MKQRIFIAIHYMEIGGAERALLGLLNALDTDHYEVDLFVFSHQGEFMPLIPEKVNLLPEIKKYTTLERPMKDVLREGYADVVLARLMAKAAFRLHARRKGPLKDNHPFWQFLDDYATPLLPSLRRLGEYDLAISFLCPLNVVIDKVKAKKKIAWIHTDYSTVAVNHSRDVRAWMKYDYIASISHDVTKTFVSSYPETKDKIVLIENILSPAFVRQQADLADVSAEMPRVEGETRILTIGRFSPPKKIEGIPHLCSILRERGVRFKWYIIGYGDDRLIREKIAEYGVEDCMIMLGKKFNPYPYIKACDLYCQPSVYEGKSVVVREAQILCRPVAITDFPTAPSQLTDGKDGIIVPLEEEACGNALADFIENKSLQDDFIAYEKTHDYGNEAEVEKVYKLIGA